MDALPSAYQGLHQCNLTKAMDLVCVCICGFRTCQLQRSLGSPHHPNRGKCITVKSIQALIAPNVLGCPLCGRAYLWLFPAMSSTVCHRQPGSPPRGHLQ